MEIYKDFKTKRGTWHTFRPLSVMGREELARRFNSLDNTRSLMSQLLDDPELFAYYNTDKMLGLYGLTVDDFDIKELDELFVNYIIPVNFRQISWEEDDKHKESEKETDEDTISMLLNSIWGICESGGDALYLMDKLPAEILIQTVSMRAEDLERMYSTDEQKRAKDSKNLIKDMIKKHEH